MKKPLAQGSSSSVINVTTGQAEAGLGVPWEDQKHHVIRKNERGRAGGEEEA